MRIIDIAHLRFSSMSDNIQEMRTIITTRCARERCLFYIIIIESLERSYAALRQTSTPDMSTLKAHVTQDTST